MLNSLDIAKKPQDTRVVVAMSGGVDSSVVAGLLHAEGYEVIGITLQLYDHGAAVRRTGSCCAGQDIDDARRVCEELGIPHYVLDYESRFREAVIDRFADSYVAGETPIPCVSCNQTVKFADLLKTARDLGADCLATGHYILSTPDGTHRALRRPADAHRDQSYFLALAGEIVHMDGRVLGRHEGVLHYTIGQRKGLGVATGEPLYVVRIDARSRRVIVGPKEALDTRRIILREVNWLGATPLDDLPADGIGLLARVRSTRPPKPARLFIKDGAVTVELIGGEAGVSPGQACVLYDGEGSGARVLGGGFIDVTRRADWVEEQLATLDAKSAMIAAE